MLYFTYYHSSRRLLTEPQRGFFGQNIVSFLLLISGSAVKGLIIMPNSAYLETRKVSRITNQKHLVIHRTPKNMSATEKVSMYDHSRK